MWLPRRVAAPTRGSRGQPKATCGQMDADQSSPQLMITNSINNAKTFFI